MSPPSGLRQTASVAAAYREASRPSVHNCSGLGKGMRRLPATIPADKIIQILIRKGALSEEGHALNQQCPSHLHSLPGSERSTLMGSCNASEVSAGELPGLDPLYIANEGRFVAFVPEIACECGVGRPAPTQGRPRGGLDRHGYGEQPSDRCVAHGCWEHAASSICCRANSCLEFAEVDCPWIETAWKSATGLTAVTRASPCR